MSRRSGHLAQMQSILASIAVRLTFAAMIFALVCLSLSLQAQARPAASPTQPAQQARSSQGPEEELQTGIALTRQGRFRDAIPHFLIAQGRVSEDYAENFNLALCYVATNQDKPAILILTALRDSGHATAEVDNLLAQAYVGDGQPEQAFDVLQQASVLTPKNEKLYLFVADACMENKSYALGLKVLDLGLLNFPSSPLMHYERGLFLTNIDRYDLAKSDFDLSRQLAPGSDISYWSAAQENMLEGNVPESIRVTREGVRQYPNNYILLQLLGESLIHSGLTPGQPDFNEARTALEKSVSLHPDYSRSQIALGKLYLMENRLDDAIAHLEAARQLDPSDTSVYSHLATAYRRKGNPQEAQKMLSILATLNDAQADKIRAGPPSRAGSVASPKVE